MTIDLDAIRGRLEAATPGPWTTGGIFDPRGPNPKQSVWGPTAPGMQSGVLVVDRAPKADATLIAHAPADIAALLDEVDRLTADRTADRERFRAALEDSQRAFVRALGVVTAERDAAVQAVEREHEGCNAHTERLQADAAAVTAERDRLRDLVRHQRAPGEVSK